ncbi:MAG: hypothetical protein AAF125_21025, partial [Chloroflexota bacterium]
MKRTLSLMTVLALLLTAVLVTAQDAGGTDETVISPDNGDTTVDIFFIACDDSAVMNLSGFAQPGFDIFYQVFNGAGGTGDSLTSLRRTNVAGDGDYQFSERISYRDGLRVAPGAIGSARVIIAGSETPDSPVFETFVDDLNDGCNDAQFTLQSSDDAGDPVRENEVDADVNGIANPDGGLLNPEVIIPEQPEVVIGPRFDVPLDRTANPGVVFALCDSFFPEADPGLIYDSDDVRVFWYWYA